MNHLKTSKSFLRNAFVFASALAIVGCGSSSSSDSDDDSNTQDVGSDSASEFTVNFSAKSQGADISCDQMFSGFGPDGNDSIGIGDLRFYVSKLIFRDADGEVLDVSMADNDYQLNHDAGSVALIDFLGNGDATLATNDLCNAVGEATARTNTEIKASISNDEVSDIASIEFDLGVPQALMKAVIQSGSAEDAPSPLNEMYWSWASGYRHLVANFTMMNATYTAYVNNSAFHIGSRDCDGASGKALTDEDECGLINTAKVMIDDFDPETDTINFDIEQAFSGLQSADVISEEWARIGTGTDEVDESACIAAPVDHGHHGRWCIIGETYGAQCHSGTTQTACASLFPNYGLELSDGTSDETTNSVFSKLM